MNTTAANRFNLEKGGRFDLTKASGGDTDFYVGLSWDEPETPNGITFDCDASVFACFLDRNDKPRLVSDGHFVYYKQLMSVDRAIHHSGDNLTGSGDGDDEQIRFYLGRLDPRVDVMSIVATIHQAIQKKQSFSQVRNAKIRVCQMDDLGNPTTQLFEHNLTGDGNRYTALHFGDIYRTENGSWQWHNQCNGYERTELGDLINTFVD